MIHPVSCSFWADGSEHIYEGFLQLLPWKDKLACERVCVAWRSHTGQSQVTPWVQGVLIDSSPVEEFDPRTTLAIPFPANEDGSFSIGTWISRRAVTVGCVQLDYNHMRRESPDRRACLLQLLKGLG